MTTDEDTDHEDLLERLLRHLLSGGNLDELCEEAGLPVLLESTGRPVNVREVVADGDAGVLALNRGVVFRLSGGSEVQLSIVTSRRPDSPVQERPPRTSG
ncbi:hypothetical protein [Micromonospora craniellae]|uniref:Uncharacterized protein n=1 Tax=Micromonospora craniellae TaxID=2294034 RepID=A0A372FTQ8_9ACTN|nr:hypothetical protein [Micromonospora craniellae]QOC89708.1 hypothetical protein ID554_15640 [Micromonospora craniellae]RFS44182.1 hypothetical protein D0Q02_23790 [Micromonospora craniellae]